MAGRVLNDWSSSANTMASSQVFYFLLVPLFALWLIYFKLSRRNLNKHAAEIPGPPGYPIIGNLFDLMGSSHNVFRTIVDKSKQYDFDAVCKLWIGPKLIVFLFNPGDVELILSSHVYIDKSAEYDFFKPWLGDGLLVSSGHKWRSHRKLIAPTFHLNVLKGFIDLFNENSRQIIKKLDSEIGKTFDAHDHMSEATVEILLETAMGVSKKTQGQSGYDYAMAVMKMCDILHARHRSLWLRANWIFNLTDLAKQQIKLLGTIHGLTMKVIRNKKEMGTRGSLARTEINTKGFGEGLAEFRNPDATTRPTAANTGGKTSTPKPTGAAANSTTSVEGLSFGQSSGLKDDLDVENEADDVGEKKRLAFLDLLLESAQNGALITDKEIKEQVDTIMFEGHDTTAAASSFFLSLMGIHQDIQEKVVEELYEIFGDSDRPATFQDTLEMKYLERCLMETLRLFPPVPIIARELKENLKLTSGKYTVPAGATVVITTILLHRDKKIYGPNPDKFDPDNFLPERSANRHYYAFIPFSAGPRSCVGRKYAMLKLKVLLSTILRNYRIHSDLKEDDFKLQADIILKREEGFQVRIERRKSMGKA